MPFVKAITKLADGIEVDTSFLGSATITSASIPSTSQGSLADVDAFIRQLIAGWIATSMPDGFDGSYDIRVNSFAPGALDFDLVISDDPNVSIADY